MTEPQPLILADPALATTPGQHYICQPEWFDRQGVHLFRTIEVAKILGKNVVWLRNQIKRGRHIGREGSALPARQANGYFLYRLHDIERLAYALTDNRVITVDRLARVLHICKTYAQQFGYLE